MDNKSIEGKILKIIKCGIPKKTKTYQEYSQEVGMLELNFDSTILNFVQKHNHVFSKNYAVVENSLIEKKGYKILSIPAFILSGILAIIMSIALMNFYSGRINIQNAYGNSNYVTLKHVDGNGYVVQEGNKVTNLGGNQKGLSYDFSIFTVKTDRHQKMTFKVGDNEITMTGESSVKIEGTGSANGVKITILKGDVLIKSSDLMVPDIYTRKFQIKRAVGQISIISDGGLSYLSSKSNNLEFYASDWNITNISGSEQTTEKKL